MIYKLKNIIQDYPWGSRSYLQELTGTGADGPLAELWMGTHPRGESRCVTAEGGEASLSSVLKGDLPFLFKLLAAGEPLSIQAHPDKKQAEEGFRRENSRAIPLDSPARNYKDDNHKPEIICAITPFWAMKGFRPPEEIGGLFGPWLPLAAKERLFPEDAGAPSDKLEAFFQALMTLEEPLKGEVLGAALDWCRDRGEDFALWVRKLHHKYPGDIAALAPLYLNTLMVEPGEALYLTAGELHAYLEGLGVELMANSDNVLRGGLTPKHVDVPELMKTLVFRPSPPKILIPRTLSDGTGIYETESEEFQLLTVELDHEKPEIRLGRDYPDAILAVTSGAMQIGDDSETVTLERGESCFFRGNGEVRIMSPGGRGFIARVGI